MTKKEYMKPTMRSVELRHRTRMLNESLDEYRMNKRLQRNSEDEVDKAW